MNAKSIYDKLVNVEGIPSSILTYSDKNDCIIIEVQDYDKSVFKFAQKFFNGYKSVDIDYTNENKTSVWYNDVSEYSDRETIDSITRFYYDMKVKGLVESKKSARKSLREMFDNEGIVDDFVDFLIYDCGYDEKTVEKYFYKKYKLNGLDVIPIKLYIQIKNEIEDVLGYNDII